MDITQITFAAIIGVLTLVIGILVKLIGFPDQFRLNHKRKSTKGLSALFFALAFFSYALYNHV
ncbi:PQ-loop repeat-containing protein [Candidatus Woesearchaeota archaeon]|nr:PQ-loop repeat-containing protein [Candidatus Woesearchaeota archaeon]